MQRQRWLGALTLGRKAAHRLNLESGMRASGRVIVESGQTCDFKCADDFFGLLVASQGRSHSKLRLIRSYKIPEMCQLRARAKRACNRRRESRCSRVQQHLAHDLRR